MVDSRRARVSAASKPLTKAQKVAYTAVFALVAIFIVFAVVTAGSPQEGPAPTTTEDGGVQVTQDGVASGPLTEVDVSEEPTGGGTPPGTLGDPVNLVIYLDFSCQHCAEFEENYGEAIQTLVDHGEITVEYRVVALLDDYSDRSAEAAACVADEAPDQYLDAVHYLSGQQEAQPSEDEIVEDLTGMGADIDECMSESRYEAFVEHTSQHAQQYITGTPSVWANGQHWQSSGEPFPEWLESQSASAQD